MPSSQLKRLKASLREQGIVGPQQSKKQKKKTAQDAQAKKDKRLKRSAALEGIREQFNPFQFKMNARGPKFQVTSNRPQDDSAARGIKGRPGVALSRSEERRRQTLLMEMQRRNKVGGILDRRFGEDDPDMTPEEKALQRFAIEKQRSHKKNSLFDLEDDEEDAGFTHLGRKLALDDDDEPIRDDFAEMDLLSDEDGSANGRHSMLKRKRVEGFPDEDDENEDGPPRRKSNQEVYKEVIAKSKFYKYERQAAKEEDEDIRVEIDKELSDLRPLLFARKEEAQAAGANDQDVPVKSIAGIDKDEFEKEYDSRLRRMIQDKRAQPSERTKTEDELAEEQSARLKELEEKRVKRMLGQEDSDDDEDKAVELDEDGEPIETEADRATHDLGSGIKATATELGFDDEDDFIIEDDLVASGSDIEPEDDTEVSEQDYVAGEDDGDDDDEFTKGLLTEEETTNPAFLGMGDEDIKGPNDDGDIPFTFPCPQTHAEFLEIASAVPLAKLVTAVQRIRALYHPSLDSRNKERLQNFSVVLLQHVAYLGDTAENKTLPALEGIIRHIHSLAKSYPRPVAEAFRSHLIEMEKQRPLSLGTRDLVMLKAIASIFPSSDHFHAVITPAMLSMGRYLGQKTPNNLGDYATGIYLSILFLEYQKLSKRYVPELVNFVMNAILALAPVEFRGGLGNCHIHLPSTDFRIRDATDSAVRKLDFNDCRSGGDGEETAENSLKIALLNTALSVMAAAMVLWSEKAAFFETFQPFSAVLKHLGTKPCRSQLPDEFNRGVEEASGVADRMLRAAYLSRRPLELHHHRPIAIKTYIPKFEESGFNPDKHYDPNRERAELAKLKAEHKKERKGIMRELRKDTHFMAREKLKIKKAKDEAYEKKYKRLVAEIQGEEGREANAYEREKQMRKKAKHR